MFCLFRARCLFHNYFLFCYKNSCCSNKQLPKESAFISTRVFHRKSKQIPIYTQTVFKMSVLLLECHSVIPPVPTACWRLASTACWRLKMWKAWGVFSIYILMETETSNNLQMLKVTRLQIILYHKYYKPYFAKP